jgi:hypothetical protein
MHKIIIGTPRSGTSFVAKWYSNKYPQYKLLSDHRLYEHFEPDYADWPKLGDVESISKETQKRINGLPIDYIFKMHSGPYMSNLIWDFVYKKPIVIVKRKDLLGQFISYGIGWTTFKWYQYADWKMPLAGLKEGQTFNYKKEWFDNLVWRIEDLRTREKNLNIERTVWFEDLPNFPDNGEIMIRQNPKSNDEKLKSIENVDDFLRWFRDWVGKWKE